MRNINSRINELSENTRDRWLSKRAAENTAFANCREDMSDIHFEIGNKSYTLQSVLTIIGFSALLGGRYVLRSLRRNNFELDLFSIICFSAIGLLLIAAIIHGIIQKARPRTSVSGKNLFYGGKCFKAENISRVWCGGMTQKIEVYSHGKKIFSFPCELDNSELFIAWVKKCGISFVDERRPPEL